MFFLLGTLADHLACPKFLAQPLSPMVSHLRHHHPSSMKKHSSSRGADVVLIHNLIPGGRGIGAGPK